MELDLGVAEQPDGVPPTAPDERSRGEEESDTHRTRGRGWSRGGAWPWTSSEPMAADGGATRGFAIWGEEGGVLPADFTQDTDPQPASQILHIPHKSAELIRGVLISRGSHYYGMERQ